MDPVAHLIFDVESVADGEAIASVKYPDRALAPCEAISAMQEELLEQTGRDFIPHSFQIPTAIVVAKVDKSFRLIDIVSLDEPHFRPHVMTDHFWRGWEAYGHPQWVTFNGRGFDLPLMELAAFRYGISLKAWFRSDGPGYNHPRNRYNTRAHLDLHELLTNFNAVWFRGGLDLAAHLLGKPGKMDTKGDQVQKLYDTGQMQRISDYCRCDVLDTYFVFLRCMVLVGELDRDAEQELVAEAHRWLLERREQNQGYSAYLQRWSEWIDPWKRECSDSSATDLALSAMTQSSVGAAAAD